MPTARLGRGRPGAAEAMANGIRTVVADCGVLPEAVGEAVASALLLASIA